MTPTDERFDRIDAALERQARYAQEFRTEVIVRFERIDERLSLMGATLTNINSQMAINTKAMVEDVERVSRLFADQWNQKQATIDLRERLEKLEEKVSKLVDPAA